VPAAVAFILVGTRAPGNLGAVCRLAKAFGFPDVRLVASRVDPTDDEARRLAHGAEDVLARVRVHDSLTAAFAGCHRTVATTARPRDWSRAVLLPAELADEIAGAAPRTTHGLVLGPEDRGLTNEELSLCDAVVSIPLPANAAATLSLPVAASILAYELARGVAPDEQGAERPAARSDRSRRGARPLPAAELDGLLGEIVGALDEIGFRPRPNAIRFRGSLRDFLARARPTEGDRLFLRHMVAQVGKWKRRVAGELRAEAAAERPDATKRRT
jgi:TrmH family RNA methyltransferase